MIGSRLTFVAILSVCMAGSQGCKSKQSSSKKNESAEQEKKLASKDKLGKKRRGRTPPPPQPDMGDPVGDAHDDEKKKELPLVEVAEYETLMLALAGCDLEGVKISYGCPAARNLAKVRRESRLAAEIPTSLGAKHIKHADEAVRVHAASLLKSVLAKSNEAVVATAIAAIAGETSPVVLARLVGVLESAQSKNKEVPPLLLALASHESPLVRAEVASAFAASHATGVLGTFTKLLGLAEKDKSDDVRIRACLELGRRVDDRALPVLGRLTADAMVTKSPKLYAACWQALVVMFAGADTSSEKAFDQFVASLSRVKCGKQSPPWEVFNPLADLSNPKLKARAPWLEAKLPGLHAAIARVAACKDANWIARAAAVDALGNTGAPSSAFKDLRRAMSKTKGDANAAKMIKKIDVVVARKKR